MLENERREKALKRLRIIGGQIGGISKLITKERHCIEILTQIASVQQALRGVAKEVVRNHLETCVASDILAGEGEKHYEELTEILFKLSR